MIEALVALGILAFGMLGLAFMQIQAMKFNTDSYARSQATVLAYDIMEKIRLNRMQAASFKDTPTGTCDGTKATVANEVKCWHDMVADILPQGTAIITEPSTGTFQIQLQWRERLARNIKTSTGSTGLNQTQTWLFRP
jgi:type IV pilus assembly protein PilV